MAVRYVLLADSEEELDDELSRACAVLGLVRIGRLMVVQGRDPLTWTGRAYPAPPRQTEAPPPG